MKHLLSYSVVAMAFLFAAASSAVAADKNVWVGRAIDNKHVFWTCSKVGGNDWKLKKNGTVVGEYRGVTSTAEFVELQLKGTTQYERVRLYNDHLSLNKKGSKTEWIQMAKGKWH